MEFGPFDLKERLGEGGMGEVWRAEHRQQGLSVALKVITDRHATDPEYRRRFQHEVRAVAALNHPGIIRILDYGEATEDFAAQTQYVVQPESPYLIMEYADGGSLHGFESELEWSALRPILAGLLEALGHAHARDIIHRDLKPSNILLTAPPSTGHSRLKLTDFGLAFDAEQTAPRSFEEAAGTPYYMAPEQFRSRWRDFGPWTDLYGLGCLTWLLVCGAHPFGGKSLLQVARAHLTDPLPDFDPQVPLPDGFDGWLARLLEKHPNDRYRSAADALWGLLQLPADIDEDGPAGSTDAPATPAPTVTRTRVTEPLESSTLDKIGPWSDSYEGPVGTESLAPNQEPAPDRTLQPAPRPSPPVPRRWQQSESDQPSMQLVGAGRQLFNLREFPMVGRRPERDRLWETLCGVAEEGRGRLLLLEGPAGVGKSRLARWLGERASQVGAGHYLRVNHSADSSEAGGLIPALARALSVRGLEGEELEDRLQNWCQARGVEEPYEWRALSGLLAGSDDLDETAPADDEPADDSPDGELDDELSGGAGPVHFSDKSEIWALVSRFIGYLARERPLVVHLDDLQWGHETLDFLHHFFEAGRGHETPVLFVGTLRDDLLADRRVEARLVDQLCEAEPSDRLAIGPLDEPAQRALVEELLRLTPAAASRVLDRAGGNPLFAVELVRDWIERDLLETTDHGFALTDGAAIPVPDDLQTIWSNRLDQIVDCQAESRVRALQLAALLGRHVDEREWRTACEIADLPFPDDLLRRLVRQNLLRPIDTGWRFAHNILQRVIVDRAQSIDADGRLNEICAQTLRRCHDGQPAPERLAQYLIGSGNHTEALEPLLTAIDERGERTETGRAEYLLTLAERAFEASDLPDASRVAARIELMHGRLRITMQFDRESADRHFERALDLATRHDWPDIEVDALIGLSRAAEIAGDIGEAVDLSRRALQRLPEEAPAALVRRANYHHATNLLYNNDYESAEAHFERIAGLLGEDPDTTEWSKVMGHWGTVLRRQGDLEAARQKIEAAIEAVRDLGLLTFTAQLHNMLGDCEREARNYERAEACYRWAEEAAAISRAPRIFPVWLGRVQIALEQRDFETARQRLERARTMTRSDVFPHFDNATNYLALETEAGLGDFEAVSERLDEVARRFEQGGNCFRDEADSLSRTADITADDGPADLAERLRSIAEEARRLAQH